MKQTAVLKGKTYTFEEPAILVTFATKKEAEEYSEARFGHLIKNLPSARKANKESAD